VKKGFLGIALGMVALAGCVAPAAATDADLRNAASTLDTVRRSGYHVEIELVRTSRRLEQRMKTLQAAPEPRPSVFIFSRTHAGFVLNAALARALDPVGRAQSLRWVTPFLEAGDLRGAPRAFAHGLLVELWQRGAVERHEPFVPMLPPEIPADTPTQTLRSGLPLALAVLLVGIVRRVPWRRPRVRAS
jgi:hypothetical protein